MKRLAIALAASLYGGAALAQQTISPVADQVTATTIVTGQPLVDAIVPWLLALTTALVPVIGTYLTVYLKQKWSVEVDTGLRDGFQSALTNGAGLLVQRLGARAATLSRFDIGNTELAAVINSVIRSSPDAISRFNITPEMIAEKLEAKLGLITGVTDASGAPLSNSGAVASIPISKAV